jgi:DNA repair protein RadC
MKRLAPADRPREKLCRLGPTGLGDNELLAVVLGQGARGRDVLALAGALLDAAGGTAGLSRTSIEDLRQVAGVGGARAAQVVAAVELGRRTVSASGQPRRFRHPRELAQWLLPQFGGRAVEQFGTVLLDARHGLLSARIVSVGSLDASAAHPREVFREAIVGRAAALVLFHNHPSGDPSPSRDDVAVTRRLVSAAAVLGIEIIDHVILGAGTYFSFRESARL